MTFRYEQPQLWRNLHCTRTYLPNGSGGVPSCERSAEAPAAVEAKKMAKKILRPELLANAAQSQSRPMMVRAMEEVANLHVHH